MKAFLLIFASILGQSAFGQSWILAPGIYEGQGSITNHQSSLTCTYDIKLTVGQAAAQTLYIIRDLSYHDPITCEFQSVTHFVIHSKSNGVFRVEVNDFEADHGFCSTDLCMVHISYTNGSSVTEGIYRQGEKFIFSGMGTYFGGMSKTWLAEISPKWKSL